jgi:hypothetical protein
MSFEAKVNLTDYTVGMSTGMDEAVVSLTNISKCYKRYAHPVERLKETLFRGIYDRLTWTFSKARH